jgi:tyrosyl-tRNA synthetase
LRLATEVTTTVHGQAAARTAAEMSRLLFGGADPRTLSEASLVALRAEVPFLQVQPGDTPSEAAAAPEHPDARAEILSLLVAGKIAASRGAARRLVEQGGVYLNGQRIAPDQRYALSADLLPGSHLLLRKGARDHLLVHVS